MIVLCDVMWFEKMKAAAWRRVRKIGTRTNNWRLVAKYQHRVPPRHNICFSNIYVRSHARAQKCRKDQSRNSILRKQMASNTLSNKQAKIKQNILIINPNRVAFYFYCLKTTRTPDASGLRQNRVGGTPEGIAIQFVTYLAQVSFTNYIPFVTVWC